MPAMACVENFILKQWLSDVLEQMRTYEIGCAAPEHMLEPAPTFKPRCYSEPDNITAHPCKAPHPLMSGSAKAKICFNINWR